MIVRHRKMKPSSLLPHPQPSQCNVAIPCPTCIIIVFLIILSTVLLTSNLTKLSLSITCAVCMYVCSQFNFWHCMCTRRPVSRVYSGTCELLCMCHSTIIEVKLASTSSYWLCTTYTFLYTLECTVYCDAGLEVNHNN